MIKVYEDEMVEGEAQRSQIGEAGGEIILAQVVLHKIQHLVISYHHVWGNLEIFSIPKAITKVLRISKN